MVGDPGEHVGKPSLRIDAVHLRRHDQRVHECSSVTVAVGAGEQPGLPPERDPAQGPLGGIVGQADAAILEEPGKAWSSLEHVVHGLGDRGVAGKPRAFLAHPGLEIGEQRRGSLGPDSEPFLRTLSIGLPLDVERGVDPLHGFEGQR